MMNISFKTILFWVCYAGYLYIIFPAAISKVIQSPHMMENMQLLGFNTTWTLAIGAAETVGAVMVLAGVFKPDTISSFEINPNTKANSEDLNYVIELARTNNHTFYLEFSELFPTFNQKLLEINPQLTPSDLEYCALMKLNFDTKQIATFKKASIGSVETRKSRIRKKLNIHNSENIYTWLTKLQSK